jgi:hypothetical protein
MLRPNDGVIIRLASERSEAVDAAIGVHETRTVIWHDNGAIRWAAASQAPSATRSCGRQSQPVGPAEAPVHEESRLINRTYKVRDLLE